MKRRPTTEQRRRTTDVIGVPEESKPELPFNPATDITEHDWKEINEDLETQFRYNHWDGAVELAPWIAILDPKRQGLNPEKFWGQVKFNLENARQDQDWNHFIEVATAAAILFPGKREQMDLDSVWNILQEKCADAATTNNPNAFEANAKMLTQLSRLFPDKSSSAPLPPKVLDAAKEIVQRSQSKRFWRGYAELTACLLTYDPSLKAELPTDDQAWEGMKIHMDILRLSKQWDRFIKLAGNMAIVASDGLRMSGDGRLELRNPPSQTMASGPELPARSAIS